MKKKSILILMGCILLTSCGLTKKDLGLAKDTPDETVVETRKPLDMPPDFDILPE